MALRRRGWRIAYLDPAVEERDALATGAADERASGTEGAELVVLATPVDVSAEFLRNHEGEAVVTSTGSVMRLLRDAARGPFVAGHPMAGAETRGLSAARADLFEGRTWFVDREDPRVAAMIDACGARPLLVEAAEHDAAVALTSHLPQLLSTALGAYLHDHPETAPFGGSGLQTFLRLAASDASVWRPILDANRDNLEPLVGAILSSTHDILSGDDEAFAKAQRFVRS